MVNNYFFCSFYSCVLFYLLSSELECQVDHSVIILTQSSSVTFMNACSLAIYSGKLENLECFYSVTWMDKTNILKCLKERKM